MSLDKGHLAVFVFGVSCGYGLFQISVKLYRLLCSYTDRDSSGNEYKLTLVARKDVKVSTNRIAVLCTHAAELANEHMKLTCPEFYEECHRQPKVVLKAEENSFMATDEKAREMGLQVTTVKNSKGTLSVLAVGPGPVDLVNEATSDLKLY